METPESLRQRLRHLADLGEALPDFAADPDRLTWLYSAMCHELAIVWSAVLEYWTLTLTAQLAVAARNAMYAAPPCEGEHGEGDDR